MATRASTSKAVMESRPSTSWVMTYHRRTVGTPDRVGGLPSHLPHAWPRCQMCQARMGFAGQLYSSDRLPLGDHLSLQFYVCEDCRVEYEGANDSIPIHMEMLPPTAPENLRKRGVRARSQPIRYISYSAVEDFMDQRTFNRRKLTEEDLPDGHLRADKVGGLFPYDGSDAPKITPRNWMLAQFTWESVNGPIYLYHSASEGIYLFHYR